MLLRFGSLLFAAALVVGPLITLSCADEARTAAVGRPRRVIFNNDGDDAWVGSAPATKEGFLSVRMDHVGDCGVDTVFYCTTQSINLFTHNSEVTEVFTGFENNRLAGLIEQGTDPLALAIEACRQRNIEVCWTIRMNDIHDVYWPELLSKWKEDNPHLLVSSAEEAKQYPSSDPRSIWTFADFAHQEVRDLIVTIIKDVLARYDVDGIGLDFLRHPAYFKETLVHQPVTPEHMAMLTDMVEDIRQEVLSASERKGRPLLLSARIFPTLALNRRFGFDVEQWVKQGYLDFIGVGGGYDPVTMPAKDMIDRGHAWGIPVYVCLSGSGISQRGVAHSQVGAGRIECWRAAAANAWDAGADGILTFNLFPSLPDTDTTKSVRAVWQEISDPEALVGKDKLYYIENLDHSRTMGFMVRSIPWEDRLPAVVEKGKAVERMLPVADDIPGLEDRIQSLSLRICLSGWQVGDVVKVQINGNPIEASAEEPQWLAGDVLPSVMKQGPNTLTVTYEEGQSDSLTITSVELSIKYEG